MKYDLIIIGSGPGGYVAAIRASQLGLKIAVVEKENIGGVCLNWGCIPTKALLKSAEVYRTAKEAKKFGINVSDITPDFAKIIKRSRTVASQVSKGVEFLFKKNNIDLLWGTGRLTKNKTVLVENNGQTTEYLADNIILATGARPRQLPFLTIDGKKIIGYRQALTLEKQPESLLIVGSGAIGTELAFFYASIGTKVTLVEVLPQVVPTADADVSAELLSALKRARIKVLTSAMLEKVDTTGDKCISFIKTGDKREQIETELVLSAVGISPNTENLGLENLGVATEKGFITVDDYYQTSVKGIYAIGDIIPTPALAHVASAEGIICVEKIAGLTPKPLNYNYIPSGIFTTPEVGSVGMTEKQAKDAGIETKIGKFPLSALGKSTAIGDRSGFVKLIYNAKNNNLIGAHIVGHSATDMIAELTLAMQMHITSHQLLKTIHPHPTISEAIMEAAADAENEAIHI